MYKLLFRITTLKSALNQYGTFSKVQYGAEERSVSNLFYSVCYLVVVCGSQANGTESSVHIFVPGYSSSMLYDIKKGSCYATVDDSVNNKLNFWGNYSYAYVLRIG